jgi:hypothetical protein
MRIKLLLFSLVSWLALTAVQAQTTVTIGAGSTTGGAFDNGAPVYRSSATSSFDFSQSLLLYTEDDLAAVGIYNGAVISSVGFYKLAGTEITAGEVANLSIDLGNTTSDVLDVADTYANLSSGFTSVYSGTVDNTVFSTASLVTIPFQNNFTYNGGSIIVGVNWDISGPTPPATGSFQWLYDSGTATIQARGTSSGSAITGNLTTTRSGLYQADFTYTGGAPPTCIRPNTLGATNITTTSADLTWVSGGSGETSWDIEVVTAGTAPTGTPTNTGVTSPFNVPALSSNTAYDFYVRANCGGGDFSVYAGPFTFTTLITCGDTIYDSGGATGDYVANELTTITLFPDNAGDVARLEFLLVDLETCCDDIAVYDGVDTSAPLLDGDVANVDVAAGDTSIVFTAREASGALTLVFDADGSVQNAGFEVVFTCIVRPTCFPPTALSVSNITDTTVDADWTTGDAGETLWDVEVVPSGTTPTGTPQFTDVTKPYTIPGLSPATVYDYYVRASCGGGDFSEFSVPESFRTTGPLDDCTTGDTLTVVTDCATSTPYSFDLSSAGNLGTSFGSCDTSGTNTGGWFEFTTTAVTTITINTTTAMKMEIVDACGGTQVECFNSTSTSRIVSGLTANTNYKLALWVDGTSSDTTDICIVEGPTCFLPTGLSVDSVTQTEATLSWTAPTQGTTPVSYDVEIVPAGTAPTGTPTDTGVTSPFTKMGLTANTAYDFYVSTDCGAGDTSLYEGPESFTTSPLCGDTLYDSGGATGDYVANELTTTTFFPDSAANIARLEFLLVDLEGCCDDITIYDGPDTSSPVLDDDVANIDVSAGDAPTVFTSTHPTGALTMVFDADFSVQRAGFEVVFTCVLRPSCLPPTDLAVDAVTDTTADLSWTVGPSTETIWDVEVVLAGATPTGTPTDEDVANPYTKTGLNPGTRYEYYLRADCVSAQSEYAGPFAFRTSVDGDTCDTPLGVAVVTTCDANTQTIIDFENAIDLGASVASCASNGTNLGSWLQFRPNRNTSAVSLLTSEDLQYAIFTTDSAGDCADQELFCGFLTANTPIEIPNLSFRDFYKLVVWDDSGSLTSATVCVLELTCPVPSELAATQSDATTATFTWTPGSSTQTSFDVSVFAAGADPLVDTPVDSASVTTNQFIASNLVIGDAYDIYVTGDCDPANAGTDTSLTASLINYNQSDLGATCVSSINVSVEADCATATPATIDFATAASLGSSFASCDGTGSNPGLWIDFVAPASGGVLVNATTAVKYVLLDGCNGAELFCESTATTLSDPLSGLTPGQSYKLAIWNDATTGTSDICITEAIGCLPLTAPVLGAVTSDEATVSWTAGGPSQTLFEVEVVDGGQPQDGSNVFTSNTSSYTIMSLMPISDYDVYVRADCGNGDFSDWLGPISFTTECAPFMAPYFTDFENFAADTEFTDQNCWSQDLPFSFEWQIDAVGGTVSGATGPVSAFSGSTFMYSEASVPADSGDVAIVRSPLIDLSALTTPELSFYYHMYGSSIVSLTVEVSNDGGATYTQVDQILGQQQTDNADPWLQRNIDLSSYLSDTIMVRLLSEIVDDAAGFAFNGDVSIDNFRVDNIPTCRDVIGLSVDAISATTVTVGFDSGETASNGNFEFVIVPAGDPAPTTAGFAISDTANTTGSYTFELADGTTTGPALTPVTDYDVYLREACSGSDFSNYAGPVSFTTSCAVFVPDYFEGFSTYVPDCWSEAGDGDLTNGPNPATSTSNWIADGFGNNGTTGSARVEIWLTNDVEWLITPEFDLSVGGYEVVFDVALTPWSGSGPDVIGSDDQVQFLMSENGGPWTELVLWNENNVPSNTGDAISLPLTSTSTNVKFAFLSTEGPTASGDVNFYVDNFQVRTPPSCFEVSNLSVVSTTTTTADITFDSGNATSSGNFEYVLVASSDPAPTGAGVAISDATVTNGSYAFTIGDGTTTGPALSPSTSYDLYVREICGAGDESNYNITGVSLETQCAPIDTFPHTTSFVNNPPTSCWEEAGDGEVADGPSGFGASDWRSDRGYTNYNGTAVSSNAINLWLASKREWLISGDYDLTGADSDFLTIEVAVTNYSFSGITAANDGDTMGTDDEVQLLVTTDGGATWTSLFTWNLQNQPATVGTREYIDISTYSGIAQFAIFGSEGTVDDTVDYDFHVGELTIDATAGNGSVELTNEISLYPNPVSGDVLNIKWSNAGVDTTNVIVHNSLGQQILSREVSLTNQGLQLDGMSSLSKGMYFVTVSNNGMNTTLKFIKE